MTQRKVPFDSASVMMYGGLVIFPLRMFPLYLKNIDWRQTFTPFSEFHRTELPRYKALETWVESFHPGNILSTLKIINFKKF